MTRETKVGVAVACSFLGLVAAVVVLRMGNPADPSSTSATSGQVAKANPAEGGPMSGKPATAESGVVPANLNLPPGSPLLIPETNVPAPTAPVKEASPMPLPSPSTSVNGVPLPPPPVPEPAPIATPPVAAPPAAAAAPVPSAPLVKPAPESKSLPGFPEGQGAAVVQNKDGAPPAPVVPGGTGPGLPAPPPAANDSAAAPAPPAPLAQDNKVSAADEQLKKELKNQVAASAQQDAPPPKPAVAVPSTPAPVAPLANALDKAPPAPANDLLPPGLVAPAPAPAAAAVPATPPAVAPPPPGIPLPVPASGSIAKEENLVPPVAPRPTDFTLKGPLGPTDREDSGRLPAADGRPAQTPTSVAMGSVPGPQAPLGAPPSGSSAPIAVPMPPPAAASGGVPKVQSFDVETYKSEAGESSFADLSKRFYGSDKYAQALLQFNREYAKAGDNLRDNPPRLQPGQPIFVPPTNILELPRYAAAPAETRPTPSTGSAPLAPPPAPLAPPESPMPPASPTPAAPPAVISVPASAVASAAGTRTYTVRASGEMLFEIARQALGDGRRWSEIYRLNPEIRPELAIPGGTQLRLPGDARVGS